MIDVTDVLALRLVLVDKNRAWRQNRYSSGCSYTSKVAKCAQMSREAGEVAADSEGPNSRAATVSPSPISSIGSQLCGSGVQSLQAMAGATSHSRYKYDAGTGVTWLLKLSKLVELLTAQSSASGTG